MDGGIYKMTREKVFMLAEKMVMFIEAELKGEKIVDVATATIFGLGMLASERNDVLVLPESICRRALTNLDLMEGGLYDNLKNS